jgi:2'-5' RNA ligase
MARLFFALWPPPEARGPLAGLAGELARRCSGRPVPAERIHLTLAFLGEVDEPAGVRAREVAARLALPPLDLVFDRVGSFARAEVAWMGMSRPDPRLAAFAGELAARLESSGFRLDHRPFVPHLTLARRIRRPCPEAEVEPIDWTAGRFALVETEPGSGRYVERGTWGGEETR